MPSSQFTSTLASEEQKLLACVHCGLCLEACPTYTLTGDENDSPRGRIYLMRAVEEGKLAEDSPSFRLHIDRCLGCRACEPVCPAGVEYGQLLEASRAQLFVREEPRGPSYRLLRFALRHVWVHPARLRLAFAVVRSLRNAGLPPLLLKSRLLGVISSRLEFGIALLASSAPPSGEQSVRNSEAASSPAPQSVKKVAGLFTGCVTAGLFSRVNDATRRVLRVNGVELQAPKTQTCCGALHAHAGDLEGARLLARQNIEAFGAHGNAPVITNAGGCGAMLVSYGHLLADDDRFAVRAKEFAGRVRDVSQELESVGIKAGANLGSEVITYDASCHLLNGQHAIEAPLKLLRSIPDLRLVPLEGAERCCGGAGVYNLLEPAMSSGVLQEKLDHIRANGARILATGNPGCQMQIGAGARLAGMELSLCHPIELLDESYRRAGMYEP
ncbi:MAG: (Fe-S)-binding protein [Pyrinomonadaceae bacterium]